MLAAHQAAQEAGLNIAHYLLLGGPGENRESLDRTLDGIDGFGRVAIIIFCGMRIYPPTPLYETAVREGQIIDTDSLLEPVFYRPPGIDPQEIIERVQELASSRPHWLIGAGDPKTAKGIKTLYQYGKVGPLWERLLGRLDRKEGRAAFLHQEA